jgi:hypothetical protein
MPFRHGAKVLEPVAGRPVLDGALANPFAHALMQCLAVAEAVTGRRYGADARADVSLRILAEHGDRVPDRIHALVVPLSFQLRPVDPCPDDRINPECCPDQGSDGPRRAPSLHARLVRLTALEVLALGFR